MSINDHKNKLKAFDFNKYAHTDLTNYGYVKLLHFILKSEKPVTSYEMQHGMGESKYILEMLNNLYTQHSRLMPLFVWEKIGNKNYEGKFHEDENIRKKLYRLLNPIYNLDWFQEMNEQYDHLLLEKHDNVMTLSYGKRTKLEIELTENKDVEKNKKRRQAVLKIYDNKKRLRYFLNTIRKKDGLHVYTEIYYNPKSINRCLDVEYNSPGVYQLANVL